MGAWGYGSIENDYALDWIANNVEWRLAMAIKDTLEAFIVGGRTDITHFEAEAAVAVLVEYADYAGKNDTENPPQPGIRLGPIFAQEGLWRLASEAIDKLLKDQAWLLSWNDPEKKKEVIEKLALDIGSLSSREW
jgi:hypothetical protein